MHQFVVALDPDRPLFEEFLSICRVTAAELAEMESLNLSAEPIVVSETHSGPLPNNVCCVLGFDMAPTFAQQVVSQGLPVSDLVPYDWIDEPGSDGDWLEQLPGYVWLIEEWTSWREQLRLALRTLLRRVEFPRLVRQGWLSDQAARLAA